MDEIIVDNFAGGGGASTGIELATGMIVSIAINHDAAAILMHKTNHPHTEHIQASVWDVNPEDVCRGRPVGLAWFSPDCKHFSKAKGSALVDRNIRGLAWIVLRWAGTVRPRVIILENVEEFQTWGPVRKGKPIRSKSGQTFRQWLSQLEALGYEVEYRELVAADYGAPTTRKRLVLVARCDGQPIRWPERTHAPRDSEEVRRGELLPWRSAAEIIDWSLPMYSIFATKQEIREKYGVNVVRPLAENTLRRSICGVDKYTIKSGDPFLVPVGYGERVGRAPRVHNIREPVPTVVSRGKMNLGAANLIQYHTERTEGVRANGLDKPLPTADASNRYALIFAQLTEYYGKGELMDYTDLVKRLRSYKAGVFDEAADAIEKLQAVCKKQEIDLVELTGELASKQPWIPIKTRPMDEEERKEWSEKLGYDIEYDEAVICVSQLPDDGQEVFVYSKYGGVSKDTFSNDPDYGCSFEENGDMDGIIAWMPLPEPPKE